jgi:hypothetical protein
VKDTNSGTVIIPVVVHILYNLAIQNISDAQIKSQIAVLNEDYNRLNADTAKTPGSFRAVAGKMRIEFKLADRTVDGKPTTGIIRKYTNKKSFSIGNEDVKYSSSGGDDIWDHEKYLNIWLCNPTDPSFIGYSAHPGSDPAIDGVTIAYNCFGRIGNSLRQYYDKGRTATHEVGHFFDLFHIWGDDGGNCTQDDGVTDTPLQGNYSNGKPSFPTFDACTPSGSGIMFENYMDYTDDSEMNLFTKEQTMHMSSILNTARQSLKNSSGYVPDSSITLPLLNLYPNPCCGVDGILSIPINTDVPTLLLVHNSMGQTVMEKSVEAAVGENIYIDASSFINGIYTITLKNSQHSSTQRFVIIK